MTRIWPALNGKALGVQVSTSAGMRGMRLGLFSLLVFILLCPIIHAAPATSAAHTQSALPDFALTDTHGKTRRLADFRGRPVALFFFCGCPWCQASAETWGRFQRGGALPSPVGASLVASATQPVTVVVFSGDAVAAQAFATQTGLDPAQTVLLPDPDLRVTTAFQADPCPRVFVLDAQGKPVYTNNHKDDTARQASALAIDSRALDALRTAASAPSAQKASPPSGITFPVKALSGQSLDLAAQPGWKVVYFWSGTCPCVRACESFTFVPLSRQYQGKVAFYAVASNGYDLKLPTDQLAHQVKLHHLPFPVLLDTTHQVASALNAKVTPQAFLLDSQNQVVFAGIPDDSRRYQASNGHWGVSKTYLAQAINQALAGQPVTVPRVKDEGCMIAW